MASLSHSFVVFILALFLGLFIVPKLIEGAASAPGTLIQLATSSPYYHSGWVRPVRQRGVYFVAPSPSLA